MDLNTLLIWTVALSCGMTLLRMRQLPDGGWLRMLLPVGILAVLGTGWLIDPETAGYIAGAVWCVLLLLPGLLTQFISSLLARRRYRTARRLATLLAVLHPSRENRRSPQLIRALDLLDRGQTETALPILDRLCHDATYVGRTAIILRTRHTGDWTNFLNWVASQPPQRRVLNDPMLLDGYLQALGETHHREELFREYERLVAASKTEISETILNVIRARTAAFAGDPTLVTEFFSGPLALLPHDVKRFWIATATSVSGLTSESLAEFHRLSEPVKQSPTSAAAKRRIEAPLPTLADEPLSEYGRSVLQRIARESSRERWYAPLTSPKPRRAWATWTLAAVMVVFFLLQIPKGVDNQENLIRMGAMLIPWDPKADWWRVLTAAFLHFGWLHFLFNLSGLLFFGQWLERNWGSRWTLFCYLLAAFGSMGLAPFFMWSLRPGQPGILAGASGGVMGLYGGLLTHTGFGRWQGRSRAIATDFNFLVIFLALQLYFDSITPIVSSEAHLLGLAIGILCGVAVNLLWMRSTARKK